MEVIRWQITDKLGWDSNVTLLTYSMERSPSWEANWSAASQEIPHILWNPKVHFRIHKCPPPAPLLSQLQPVQLPHPSSWRSILILFFYLRLGLPSDPIPSGFPTLILYTPLPHKRYMTHPFRSSQFNPPNNIGEQYRSLSSSLCSFSTDIAKVI